MCFDEFGPVEVRPQGGSTWAPKGKPRRRRATYTRTHGVRYYFSAYDVHADRLWMHAKRRKRHQEMLEFVRALRGRYPSGERIYLVMDNLSTHTHNTVLCWCRRHNIEPIFTATNASWMNRIECHFAPLRRFVIDNSDYPDHGAIARAVQDYLRWRNKNANCKKILDAQNSISTL